METTLAAEFGVSRGPVRDALRLLEKDGLVTILARRGAQVTKLSIQEVREIFDIRVALNGLRDRGIAEDPERPQFLPLPDSAVAELSLLAPDARHRHAYLQFPFRTPRPRPPPRRAAGGLRASARRPARVRARPCRA